MLQNCESWLTWSFSTRVVRWRWFWTVLTWNSCFTGAFSFPRTENLKNNSASLVYFLLQVYFLQQGYLSQQGYFLQVCYLLENFSLEWGMFCSCQTFEHLCPRRSRWIRWRSVPTPHACARTKKGSRGTQTFRILKSQPQPQVFSQAISQIASPYLDLITLIYPW